MELTSKNEFDIFSPHDGATTVDTALTPPTKPY